MPTSSPDRAVITVAPARVVAVLALTVLCLLLAHLLAIYLKFRFDYDYAMGFIPRFHMNYERGIPAYFSATLFLAGAMLFYFLHRLSDTEPSPRRHWLVLCLVFVFLAVDEATSLHELLTKPVTQLLGTSGMFRYAWVIPYGIAVVLLGTYLLRPLWRLRPDIRLLFFLAAAVYVTGALGMEMVAGYFGLDGHTKSFAFEAVITIEELMEMAGLILLIYAQLRLMQAEGRPVAIRVH